MDLIKALLPSICVALLFWYVMRNILRADRTEREQIEKFYSEHEVRETPDNDEANVRMTAADNSDYGKSGHGTGDATRPHG
ncbi:hypothetical protein DFO66_11137 [Brevibacterium sanguinis]|uniref:Uncharacterized protein n=2 Tax=Brevibacterium TaxID=1696 RepID=A0A366IGL3_9MICO|nr:MULTISPECIES: hypothetical protein [Brevibacterium]RBP63116.1 hypothetical protein DFO66_11137 [Brevibacterium sanguinis]RBP69708.1 hypothetical protein DFO65_11169 [Brevibacterium celere]